MENINWEPVSLPEEEQQRINWEPVSSESQKLMPANQSKASQNIYKENEKWILDFAGQDWANEQKAKGPIEYKEAWDKLNKWEMIPYLNAKTLIDDVAVYKSMKKIQNNEKLSEAEYNNVREYVTDMAEIQLRGYSLGGQFVNAGAQGLSFIGEFATSAGIASAFKKGTQETVELGVKKGIKATVKKGIKGIAKTSAKGLAMTAVMPHRVADSYLQRKISDGITITDKGEAYFTESTEKPATTLLKAVGDVWIENSSEFAGEALIKPLYTGIGKGARIFVPKVIREGLDVLSRQVTKLPFTKAVTRFGYDGILEELGEERLADLLRTSFDLDQTEGYSMEQFGNAMFPGADQLLVELGVIGMYGGVSNTTNYVVNKLKSKNVSEGEIKNIVTQSSELEKKQMYNEFRMQENEVIKNMNVETIDKIRSEIGAPLDLPIEEISPEKTKQFEIRRKELIKEAQNGKELTEDQIINTLESYERIQGDLKKTRKETSLIQFIKETGGLFDEGGELKGKDIKNISPFLLRKNRINKRGVDVSPDAVGVRAYEAGYFDRRPSVSELFNAIEEETKGFQRIREGEGEAAATREIAFKELQEIEALGIDFKKAKELRDLRNKARLKTQGIATLELTSEERQQIEDAGVYIRADDTYNAADIKSIVNRYDALTTRLEIPEITELVRKEEIEIDDLKELARNKEIEIEKPETVKDYLEKNITPELAEQLNIPELEVSEPKRLETRKIQNTNDLIQDLKNKGIIEQDATMQEIQNLIPEIDDIYMDVQKGIEYKEKLNLKERATEALDRLDIQDMTDINAIEKQLAKPIEAPEEIEAPKLTEEEIEQKWQNTVEENYRIQEQVNSPGILKTFKEGVKNFSNKGGEILDDIFTPFETRLYNINPKLKAKFKKFTFFSGKRLQTKMKRVDTFLQKTKKMNKKDFYELDLALKNRNIKAAERLAEKYNFTEEYQDIKDLFHEIYLDAVSVGIDMNEMENYFVRQVDSKKLDNYLEYLNNLAQKGKVDAQNNIDSNEAKISAILETLKREPNYPVMSTEQKTTYINSRLRGFGNGNLLMFKRPSSLKKNRKIAELTPEMNQFYKPFTESLISYVEGTSETIENRRLFGGEDVQVKKNRTAILRKKKRILELTNKKRLEKQKQTVRTELTQLRKQAEKASKESDIKSIERKIKNREQKLKDLSSEKWISDKIAEIQKEIAPYQKFINDYYKEAENNIDESVGKLVRDMVDNEVIYAKDERIVRKLIAARFNDKSIGAGWGLARDLGYLGTLNDIGNAVTQLGDLSLSAYKTGLFNTIAGINKTLTGKKEISLEDLGIERMSEEFRSTTGLQKLLSETFKKSNLNLVDGFGKNSFLNGAVLLLRQQSKNNSLQLNESLDLYFPEKKAEIKQDLKDGKMTDDIQFLAYELLSQTQPISKDQLPITYFRGGFYRAAYMLKTYPVKLLDLVINDIFKNIADVKSPKNVIKGLKNLVMLQTMMLLFGVPKDKLMNLILGRDQENSDLFVNNLLVFQLLNKYNLTIARRKGIGEVAKNFMIPPTFDMLSTVSKDVYDGIAKGKDIDEMRSISFIPIAGRIYYYRNKPKRKRKGRKRGRSRK
jgi:hypothetical protein